MKEQKEYLTKKKFDELKAELDDLKTNRRKEIAENLEYAKSLGDLSENAEYQEAREMQASTEERIAKIEALLKNASIVNEHHSELVEVGSAVTIEKQSDKSQKTFHIVGSEETDMSQNKISLSSPIGAALVGKKKSDLFSVKTPQGEVKYKIVNLE